MSPQAWRRRPSETLIIALVVVNLALAAAAVQRDGFNRDFIFLYAGLTGLLFCPLLAGHMLLTRRVDAPLPLVSLSLTLLGCLTVALGLGLSDSALVKDILGIIHRRFQQPYWHWVGLVLAALIYLPLLGRALRKGMVQRRYADFLVCGCFLLFLLGLYLPFGFNSIGHWETWSVRAHLEGQFSWKISYELVTRFWAGLPHLLAIIISPESFVGFHVVHLLIIWGKLVLFYGILRQLGLARLFAFLTTALLMVYPVNSDLLSLRSLPIQFSVMSLMAAVYLALEYRAKPHRLKLLGIWLSTVLNVVSNETGYAVILVAPLLWHWEQPRAAWGKVRLTLAWYLIPATKAAHLLLLSALGFSFYNSGVFEATAAFDADRVRTVAQGVVEVYRHTFIEAWQTALQALSKSYWLPQNLFMLAMVAALGLYLAQASENCRMPNANQSWLIVLGGFAFVIPAVGVLIWLDQYSGDAWRMYFYVPVGAAMALAGFLALLTTSVRSDRKRAAVILALCLGFMLLATARLYAQHARIVRSADKKAAMLYNLMSLLPRMNDDTLLLLTTDMSREQLDATSIWELGYGTDLDNSLLFVLYGSRAPVQSIVCISRRDCQMFGDEETFLSAASPEPHLQRTLVVRINEDLSVELISDPAAYFGLALDTPYDAEALYSPDAPLPPRAATMLGAILPNG